MGKVLQLAKDNVQLFGDPIKPGLLESTRRSAETKRLRKLEEVLILMAEDCYLSADVVRLGEGRRRQLAAASQSDKSLTPPLEPNKKLKTDHK